LLVGLVGELPATKAHDEPHLHHVARAYAYARIEDEVVANAVRDDDLLAGRPVNFETRGDEGLLDF